MATIETPLGLQQPPFHKFAKRLGQAKISKKKEKKRILATGILIFVILEHWDAQFQ